MLRTAIPTVVLGLLALTSCGTAISRGSGTACGAYPFLAVVSDGYLLSKVFDGPAEGMGMQVPGWLYFVGGLVSLPVDLVVDTVLLPADLVAWSCGYSKVVESSPSERKE